MKIQWEKIEPEEGLIYHTFKLRAGGITVINAFTKRKIAFTDTEEPVWSWRINGAKPVNDFWTEEAAQHSATELLGIILEELKEQLQ